MRYVLLAQILLLSLFAFGGNKAASCELATKNIVSRSSSGIAQVSNLGDIQITCYVLARPFPTKAGEFRNGLKAATTVYEISADNRKKLVASEANRSGEGGESGQEYVEFSVHIPLAPKERETEARRSVARMVTSLPQGEFSEEDRQRAVKNIQKFIYQHRVGRFYIECRVLDEKRVIGIGTVELEVLFKGRFSDFGPPGFSPA